MREGVALRRPVGAPQALAAAETILALDMLGRDFGDEAAGDAAHPLAIDAAVRGVIDACAMPRAGDRDIGEPALLFEAGHAALVHRALRRKHSVLPPGKENMVEFEALGGVDRHDRHRFGLVVIVAVHHQADMLEERLQRLILLNCAD